MRVAAATAASAVRTTSARGTGTPVAASSRFVSFLSPAMSTPREPVTLVIVARMRFWWTPWPSWTSDWSLRRIDGMSRSAASSRMACVDGPNASRSARRMSALELSGEVERRLGLDEVVDEAHGELAGRDADALLGVGVDDVVAARFAGPARLAAADLGARLALELERDVLGHVPDPGALAQPILEAADPPGAAGVLADAGQHLEQRLGEAGDGVDREVLEHAEVDDELDGRVVVPVVRPAVDAGLDDLQLRLRDRSGRRAGGSALARARAPLRASSLAGLLDAAGAERAAAGALGSRVVGALGGDAADQAAGRVGGGLEAGQLAIGGAHRAQRRHQLSLAEVEPIARRQASGA